MPIRHLSLSVKELEEGLYSLRATGTAPDGGLEVVYSRRYSIRNRQELREEQAAWIDGLQDQGYTGLQVKAILQHELPKSYGSVFMGLSLTELNKEFILDI